ncbi:HNH endonuclease, partial [Arthrobacter sp. Hz1]
CDAPIRHYDHIIPWHRGGPTSIPNSAGLCEACNHTKETPGWTAQPRPRPEPEPGPDSGPVPGPGPGTGSRHTFRITTPTGHTYNSTAPPLPGTWPVSGQHRHSRHLRSWTGLSSTSWPNRSGRAPHVDWNQTPLH